MGRGVGSRERERDPGKEWDPRKRSRIPGRGTGYRKGERDPRKEWDTGKRSGILEKSGIPGRGAGSREGGGHPGKGKGIPGRARCGREMAAALCSLLRPAPGGSRGAAPHPGGISPALREPLARSRLRSPGAAQPRSPTLAPRKRTAQHFPAQSPTWKRLERNSHPAPGSWGWRGKRWGMGEDRLNAQILFGTESEPEIQVL